MTRRNGNGIATRRNGSKDGSGREGQGRAGDSAPAELVLDAGGGMQRPPCLTYSEDTIADSAARRNPVRVDVPRARIIFDVEMDLEDQGPVCGRRPRVQAIPSAGCRVGHEGEPWLHGIAIQGCVFSAPPPIAGRRAPRRQPPARGRPAAVFSSCGM